MKSIIITFVILLYCLIQNNLFGQWQIISDHNITIDTTPLMDVYFINQDKGFVCGGEIRLHGRTWGSVFMTNDGGLKWKTVFSNDEDELLCPSSLYFINDSTGYIGVMNRFAESGCKYTSIDGGETWIEDYFFPGDVDKMFFVNDSIGFTAVGDSICRTTDGGESWEGLYHTYTGINSLFLFDENTGIAVKESGIIFKFSEMETYKKVASGTTLPLKKVFFADRNTGWIAGGFNSHDEGFHPILLKTKDGGDSWIKIENVNYLINDLYFLDKNHGFAVGEDITGNGVILKTVNGGNDWSVEVDSLSVRLNAIHFKDGYGWAVGGNYWPGGGNGLILTNGPRYTSIPKHYIENNINNVVLINYPNPFSSTTVISYKLPEISDVELSVYNLLGQKVTTLVKERQQPGSYEVEWNVLGMNPGIYYCELKTDIGRKVMKMILLRE